MGGLDSPQKQDGAEFDAEMDDGMPLSDFIDQMRGGDKVTDDFMSKSPSNQVINFSNTDDLKEAQKISRIEDYKLDDLDDLLPDDQYQYSEN